MKQVVWGAFAAVVALSTVALASQHDVVAEPPAATFVFSGSPSTAQPGFFSENAAVAQACCKVCRKGKACGDSCISRDKDCHQPPGCACDG